MITILNGTIISKGQLLTSTQDSSTRKGFLCFKTVVLFESASSPIDPERRFVENASHVLMADQNSPCGWGEVKDNHHYVR